MRQSLEFYHFPSSNRNNSFPERESISLLYLPIAAFSWKCRIVLFPLNLCLLSSLTFISYWLMWGLVHPHVYLCVPRRSYIFHILNTSPSFVMSAWPTPTRSIKRNIGLKYSLVVSYRELQVRRLTLEAYVTMGLKLLFQTIIYCCIVILGFLIVVPVALTTVSKVLYLNLSSTSASQPGSILLCITP